MLLKGKSLVPKIQKRQKLTVDQLRKKGIIPKLAIIRSNDHPAIDSYMKIKKRYGAEIGASVEIFDIPINQIDSTIKKLNKDKNVHGIIVQLPLCDMSKAERLLDAVAPHKDVDGLGKDARFAPATPTAILNLLFGYHINLEEKKVVLIGRGKLVGQPLFDMLQKKGINVEVVHSKTENPSAIIDSADVIITATGKPGVITSNMIKPGTVVIDAGTAGEGGKTVGDLTPDIVVRDDIDVSPTPGGVGPLTVCALFENVIKASSLKTLVTKH
jgi:methylenetetrahydrofolate dehydrogenase (NADP+)/methenyltetrahydrofolate cyclohydrolase